MGQGQGALVAEGQQAEWQGKMGHGDRGWQMAVEQGAAVRAGWVGGEVG